jgi:carboxymethylenebutenolidase
MDASEHSGIPLVVVLCGVPAVDAGRVEARWTARGYTVASVAAGADIDETLARVKAAMDAAGSAGRPIAVAGYGDGGRYAFLAATRLGADGAAAFCGSGIGSQLDEARFARVTMSLHFADDDPRVPPAEVRAIKGALEGVGTIDIYRYEHWDAAAEMRAEARAFAAFDGLRAT